MPDPTDLFKPPATPVTTQEKPVTAQEMFAPSKRPSRGKAPKHVQPDNNSEHYKRTVDWLASGGKTPIEQPPAPPANVPPGPIEQMVGPKTALEYPSGAKGAMPEYVRRGMLARLASQAVPQSLQDPRNWPEDYKQKLLDPSSDEARMNAYDQDKYGRPTFGYVSDPDRDKYKRQVDLEKKPGTIYSEAKAMDAELSKRGIDLQKSDRDALIGYIWLHNQMKSDDDPVMPGSGVQAAMMAAHGDIGHLKELIDQGRARRGAEALYAGEKPLDRDAEALLSRTRGETSPAEMTRLLGPLGDSGNVNLTSGEQAQSSDTHYIKDFNKRMGIGTYAQEMGVPESMRPRDLARAGAALDNPQFGQSGLMKSAGYEKDSVEAQMLEAVPALAKVPDVNWGALAGQALVESFATGNPSAGLLRVLSDPGARGDVAALGSVMMRPMSTMRHLGARLSDEELSSLPDNKSWIVSAGESTGDFIGQMALMHLAGVPIKGMAIASQILQTLPDFTLSMYEHGGDAEKAVSQTLGGLASGFDPSIPFDATKPVAQRVSTGLNLGMMALGLTLNGLKTSGKLQSKAPSTKGVNLTDAEWANLPAGLLHQGERIRSEINNGLLRANGHDIESAHPDLASALAEQSHGAASVLVRAAQHIENRGGANAAETLAKIKFGFNGELNGVTPEVEAAIKEVVPKPAAVDNPPAPTGAVVNENGHVEIGTTNFWMPNLGKRTAKIVVMPLDELITSHNSDTFEINPNYPTDMQPRDRTREAYRMQVQDIASKFDHEQHLEDYHKLDDGSPAILPDGTVVSGNGRAMALQKLAAGLGNKKAWAEYQARVKAMAGGKADGMKNPVIVRMLDEMPSDHARSIAEEANRGSGMTMGATEEASIASGKIPDNFWQSLTPVGTSIDTTINSPKNRGIVTRWLQSFPKTEQGRYLAPDGSLNMDGKTAFKRAAVADLLGPDGKLFMERLFETNDESARLASGVFQALPELIKAKSPELAKALNALLDEFDRYRTFHDEQGFSWDQYKLQGTLHNVPTELTSVFHELGDAVSKGSANKVSDVLTNLVNQGEFREIANKLAGQESLLSSERSKDAFLVVRNFHPSFGKLIENLGGKDLGDSYYAIKNGPDARMLIDQAGVQVDRTRTNDYNKRYADQSGLFGEEQAAKEPPMPEPKQESLFSKGTERTPDKTTTRAEITFDNETGNALVQLGPGATVAEVAHESAHFIERHLTPDMLRQVSDALGFGEKWTTENKERFARAFELYLTEKASVPGADPVMASLANAVRDVYERRKVYDDAGKQVKSTPEGSVKWQAEPHIGEGELSVPDSLRSIFDDMTAHPESWPGMVARATAQEADNATVPTEQSEPPAEPQVAAEPDIAQVYAKARAELDAGTITVQEFNKRFDAWRSDERGSGGEDFRVGPGFRLRSVDVITEKMKGPMMFRDFLQMLRNNGVKETEINDLDIGGSALIIAEGNGGKVDPGRILSKIKENAPNVYSERRLARLFSDSNATPEERAKVDDLRDGIKSLFDKLSKSGGTQSLMTAARQYLSNRGVFDLRGEELKLRQRVTDIIHHEYDDFGYDSRHQAYADIERAMHLSGESAEESLRGFDYKHGMDGSSVPQDLVDAINKHFEFEQKHNALLSMIDRDGHVSKYAVERLFPYSAAETEGLHRQLEKLQKQKQNIEDKYRPEHSDKKLKLPNGDNYRETVVSSPYAGYSHFGQHFSDYGYNFHTRATDRVVDGRPTTFLEEVQSDAHQAARRLGGYAEPGKGIEHNEGKPNYTPFQKTWERIAIDRAILDAIEKGNEQIAWTSGEVHADRYFEDETGMEFDSTPGASERNAKRSRGFQSAYDERLVNIANDIGKKYGVRAEKTTVEGTPAWKFTIPDELSKEYTDKGPTLFSQERGAQENFKKARHEATRYLTYGMPRLTEENPSVATAAGRFGQTRGDVMRIITTAATVMKRITGKAETIGEFRKFASVDRLYGIEARWRGFADAVDKLDEAGFLKDYKKLAETADVASAGTSAHVQTMVDNGHADIARMLLKNVFNDAAVRVGKNADSLMTPEQYEEYKSAPEYSKLKDAWIEHAQDELKKIHLANDGVLTDALGPEGLQVPLIGLDVAGEPVKGPRRSRGSNGKTTVVVGGRSVLADPPNLSNKMATGLSPGGYDMSPEGFHGRVLRDAFFSNKGAFLDSLKDAGLVREVDDATFGRMKKEEAAGNLQLNPVSGDNVPAIAIESGGKRYVIAEHAAKEIKHLLDTDDPLRYSDDLSQIISRLTKFQLAGIIEPLVHSRNLFSALVSLTPYLNKDVMSMSIGNTSVTKLPYAIWRASKTDVFSQEGTRMMKKLSDAGALPNRTMEVTTDKGLADQTGANVPGFAEKTNVPLSSTAFLFGPTGVDMRVRVMLGHIAEQMGLQGRQFRDFVNQAGAYNPAYASVAERFFKRTGIGPFYTAGQAFNIGGAKSLIGQMPGARVQERVLQQISGGMASAMATWYVASILITGKPPAPDEKIGEVPIGGGQSINTMFLTPLVERGLRTTGIKAGLDAHAQGANNDQAFDAAFRQVFNAWSHPMLSGAPAHASTTAIAGVAPYMTSTTDVTGRQGMSFLRSAPDVGGGPKQVAYNIGYAALNINPLIGKIAESTGIVPPPYKPHAGEMPEDEVLDFILSNSLPGLVKHRSDPADTRERYQKKAKATASAIDESNWEKIQGAMSKESIEVIKEFSLSPSPKKSRGEPQEAFDARVKAAATAWDAALKQIPSMKLTKEEKRAIAEQMTSEVFKKQKS